MMLCPKCGRENPDDSNYCLSCGQRLEPPMPGWNGALDVKKNSLALASLITRITGFLTVVFGVGLVFCAVSVVLGVISLNRINASRGILPGTKASVAGIVLSTVGFCMLAVGLPLAPAAVWMREDVKNTRCQENLKRVGMALRMYCSDFDDHLPPADAWCDATRKYMGLEELCCPMMPRAKSGYAFNIDLDSVRRSEPDEEKTPLCFDGGGGKWNRSGTLDIIEARHSGFGNVVYVDGHVKPLYTEDY